MTILYDTIKYDLKVMWNNNLIWQYHMIQYPIVTIYSDTIMYYNKITLYDTVLWQYHMINNVGWQFQKYYTILYDDNIIWFDNIVLQFYMLQYCMMTIILIYYFKIKMVNDKKGMMTILNNTTIYHENVIRNNILWFNTLWW